jgi:sec-independent protein translocase protein TatA
MGNLSFPEIMIILLVVLLVFGAKRLPEIGQSMGKGIREFKRSLREVRDSVDDANDTTPPARQIDARPGEREDGEPKKLSE